MLKALPVGQIATSPIASCSLGDEVLAVLARPDLLGYDSIGVVDGSRLVGLLRRHSATACSGPVQRSMVPIESASAVRDTEPLTEAIRVLASVEPLLVKWDSDENGIVTRSDLLRLPVRVLCFLFVAQLELTLAKAITKEGGHDSSEWKGYLSPTRLEKLEQRRQELLKYNMDPSWVELLELCDKRVVARKLLGLPSKFEDDVKSIESRLRNPVAHASNFLGTQKDAEALLRHLQSCFHWSQVLRLRYRLSSGGFTPLEEVGCALFGDAFERERRSWQ